MNALNNSHLNMLSNTHTRTGDIGESVPGDVSCLAIEVQVEQSALPVAVAELVRDVPAERPKLLPLLHTHKSPFFSQTLGYMHK